MVHIQFGNVAKVKAIARILETKRTSQAVSFIANYVSKIYGPHFIDGWIRKNKDQRFINLITMSDVAYCITLVENYHKVWTEEIEIRKEIEKLPENEQGHFKRKKLTKSEKEQFLGREPKDSKFAHKKGNRRKYMSHGWNEEGIAFYNKFWKFWKGISSNRINWDKMGVLWDDYADKTGFGKE